MAESNSIPRLDVSDAAQKTILDLLRARWRGMHKRCSSSRPNVAARYKDRGISVCQEWASFGPFMDHMLSEFGIPDIEGCRLTLDRIKNDEGYKPGNVRWATYKENIRNRSSSVRVEYMGRSTLLVELAETLGLPYLLLSDRIRKQGWSVERAVSEPVNVNYLRCNAKKSSDLFFELRGREQSLLDWSIELGFNLAIVKRRINAGWTLERALTAPLDRANGAKTRTAKNQGLPESKSVLRALLDDVPSQ